MISELILGAVLAGGIDCGTITSDRILGADLARVRSELSAIPANAVIGFAPRPGTYRRFSSADLERIAAHYDVKANTASGEICFGWRMKAPDMEAVVSAMREAVAEPAEISVISVRPSIIPDGRVVFPRSGLAPGSRSSQQPVEWRGYVQYAPTLKFPVIAQVSLRVSVKRVVAATALQAGIPITPEMLSVEAAEFSSSNFSISGSVADYIGRIPRKKIPAGTLLRLQDVSAAPQVAKDSMVDIEVRTEKARLTFAAKAEAAGNPGDVIPFRNPSSGKRFLARVESKDRAIVAIQGVHP